MQPIDDVVLNFSPNAVVVMNIILGIVMFGVALDMKATDFDNIRKFPRSVGIGLLSQFLFLPAFTFLLILILDPIPSMAMGMLLVAACPGGNISNFLTHFAKGNTALSVCMSAISTLCAIFMTPLNFTFWGSYHPEVSKILKQISISPLDMATTILCILGLPLVAGLFIAEKRPHLASRLKDPMKKFSLVVFIGFVFLALVANWNSFIHYIGWVFVIVLLHNSTALATGYLGATFLNLPNKDRKAITIEVGIQNSALGLTIIFTFFQKLGGMAIVACWWGIWHIIAGLSIAYYWSRKEDA
ncbi:bile acid:sodium symporter family protein [Candidatus Uabimicrobium amorphum]|uniref:Symporter n=1 Tax=Uabimicrobium amorphum TaxID=2596890 RepID=A0A5S9F328_UABAM|nr:bile acid:sodium symporter family protein [Candidatus Uabimicrobium amorphum]BBM84307.1 symporter [Candidatus Uabimicrobium amorphum]